MLHYLVCSQVDNSTHFCEMGIRCLHTAVFARALPHLFSDQVFEDQNVTSLFHFYGLAVYFLFHNSHLRGNRSLSCPVVHFFPLLACSTGVFGHLPAWLCKVVRRLPTFFHSYTHLFVDFSKLILQLPVGLHFG